MSASAIRSRLFQLLSENPNGHHDPTIREAFASSLREYTDADGSDPNDVIYAIASSVFGIVETPPNKKAKNGSSISSSKKGEKDLPIVSFDYMKEFITQVFLSYGASPSRAEVCADVLIEADKRGIDSHGLGRLKPIYCDRMDKGILYPDQPIDIVAESDACALVDGNLGLGLYIGPYCMQMAIDRAKRYGVGFVAVRNSTVSTHHVIVLIHRRQNSHLVLVCIPLSFFTCISCISIMVLLDIMLQWPPIKDGTPEFYILTLSTQLSRADTPNTLVLQPSLHTW